MRQTRCIGQRRHGVPVGGFGGVRQGGVKHGANLPQPLAILALTPDLIKKTLEPQQRQQLQAALASELVTINQQIDPHERLSCLVVDQIPWTVESGLITPTLKAKRNQIEEVYGPSFESWCEQKEGVIWVN